MVILAITPIGLKDALRLVEGGKTAVWCGADAISDDDYTKFEQVNVSRFALASPAKAKTCWQTLLRPSKSIIQMKLSGSKNALEL